MNVPILSFPAIKTRLSTVSPVYKFSALVVVLAILLGLTFRLGGYISKRNYERQLNSLRGEIKAAKDESDKFKRDADLADRRAVAASNQLAIVNQRLAEAQAVAVAATRRTEQAKVIYVQSKTNPTPALDLSGDNVTDRQRLCAELASLGHACKP